MTRPSPFPWPNGVKIAVTLTVAWEAWSPGVAEARGDVPTVPREWRDKGVPDLMNESWQAYGTRRGIWRLMELLARCRVATTGVFSGLAIDNQPEIAREWVAQGHEIAAHSYAQEILTYTLTRDEERANIRRCVDAIRNAAGQPPLGWCSPALQPSAHSVDLLIEAGFLYSMDFADDDIPYVVERPGGRLVAIPYQYDLNDMGLYAYTRQPPSVYFEFFRRKFDYLYAEGMAGDPKMLNATVHAQLFGRAFGASVLEECIRYARRFSGVWFARRDDIARWVLKNGMTSLSGFSG